MFAPQHFQENEGRGHKHLVGVERAVPSEFVALVAIERVLYKHGGRGNKSENTLLVSVGSRIIKEVECVQVQASCQQVEVDEVCISVSLIEAIAGCGLRNTVALGEGEVGSISTYRLVCPAQPP